MSVPPQQVLRRSYPAGPLYQQNAQAATIHGSDPFVAVAHKALNLAPSPYTNLFFSSLNMDTLQRALRLRVQSRLGVAIDRQSDDDLSVIMRAVFVNWQKQPASLDMHDVARAVAELNGVVMKIIFPQVASGASSYLKYLKDASQLPTPLPHPLATSTAGTKNLPIFSGV